jgi:hypothetical protein
MNDQFPNTADLGPWIAPDALVGVLDGLSSSMDASATSLAANSSCARATSAYHPG